MSFLHRLRVVRIAAFGFAVFLTGALSSAAFAGDCIGCIVQEVSGKVGIGTTTPTAALLDVYSSGSDIAVYGESDSGDGADFFSDSGSGNGVYGESDNGGGTGGYFYGGGVDSEGVIGESDLGFGGYFTSNGGGYALITGNGNVGIGTTGPSTPLHVYTATAAVAVATFQNGTGTCTFTPTTTTWSCSSDARLKKDIVDSSFDALAWAGDMRIRDFTMRSDNSRVTGVIAQEMLKTHPDMVHKLDTGYYTVDAPNPWRLVKAIQELKALFDGDHEEIAGLKAANDNLHAANNSEAAQIKSESAQIKALTARLDTIEHRAR